MGHSSPEEVLALIPEARTRDVEQILVTHGLGQSPTPDQIQAMADHDVVIELVWLAVMNGQFSYADYADAIRTTAPATSCWRPTSDRRGTRCTPTA